MKKTSALAAALSLSLSLTPCGGTPTPAQSSPPSPPDTPAASHTAEADPISEVTPSIQGSETTEIPEAYAHLLTLYETAAAEHWGPEILGRNGLSTLCYFAGYGSNAVGELGYLLADLDGDGGVELLIGLTGDDPFYANMVYDLYTAVDGEAVQLASGWNRSRWYLRSDHTLLHEGASSAFYSFWDVHALENGALTPVEALEHDANTDREQPYFFYTGSRVDSTGNRMESGEHLSSQEGEAMARAYEDSCLLLDFIPFASTSPDSAAAS